MALVMRLENRAATTTLDLLGTGSIWALHDSWRQSAALDGKITEVFRIGVKSTTRANVRTAVKNMETLLVQATDWVADTLLSESVWLRVVSDGETARRALVTAFEFVPQKLGVFGYEMANNVAAVFDVVITRHQHWESVTAATASTTGLSVWGGTWDLTAAISGGLAPGRVSMLRVTPNAVSYKKLWVGIRPPRLTTTSFTGTKDLHANGTLVGSNASKASGEAGETGTGHIYVDFDTQGTAMAWRVYWTLGSNWDDYTGRFILLARYKLKTGTSGTVAIGASAGFTLPAYDAPMQRLSPQYVTSTDWSIVELGEVQIPPSGYRGGLRDNLQALSNVNIAIEAARVDGNRDLLLDSLGFIPAEHHLVLDGPTASTLGSWFTFANEDDTVDAYSAQNIPPMTLRRRLAVRGDTTWGYPRQGGVLVFAALQAGGAHDVSGTLGPSIEVLKRWKTYAD